MFYPENSLRKGGRFYLVWVADSWPLRFATITHRQLHSQDIRDICNDLLEVITQESGYTSARFSLRLSSQLLRGLVRLYHRKATVFLSELCMINAFVIKHTNKKWVQQHCPSTKTPRRTKAHKVIKEIPDNDDRVEERIQNSDNVVNNIEAITLKESVIPEVQFPNEGFGEENPEQAMQFLADRTMEVMLAADGSAVQYSGLELPALDHLEKSHDKSRHFARESMHMEPISEHDLTIFRKSIAPEEVPLDELGKDIPQIPVPELPIPIPSPEKPAENGETEPAGQPQPEDANNFENRDKIVVELEELGETEIIKRKRSKKLIIDKNIKLASKGYRIRLENPKCELRCEEFSDDVVDAWRLPYDIYFNRPAKDGWRVDSAVTSVITNMFRRNLGVVGRPTRDEELERMLFDNMRKRRLTRGLSSGPVNKTMENTHLEPPPQEPQISIPVAQDLTIVEEPIVLEQRVSEQIDISNLPTQVLPTVASGERNKRRSAAELDLTSESAKRRCHSGFVSFRQSQELITVPAVVEANMEKPAEPVPDEPVVPFEFENQNVELELGVPQHRKVTLGGEPDNEKNVSLMLEEAGLADGKVGRDSPLRPDRSLGKRRTASDEGSSETPLGSLDRTKVDLGDSEKTTDSQLLLRKEWGTQGTMLRFLRRRREVQEEQEGGRDQARARGRLSVRLLLGGAEASRRAGARTRAARCFASLLKLHQHNFIVLHKDPETLEIIDISLGTRVM